MLRLYDTRTGQVERIVPEGARALRMRTCGPAVHRFAHLGDLRSHLLSDLIRRVGERRRLRVVVCRDIIDVGRPADDAGTGPAGAAPAGEVLSQARAEGRDAPETARLHEAARLHEDAFTADATALNIRPPEHSPRATETIEPMIELVAELIGKGHAYPAPDGSVFFDAASFPSYGEVSSYEEVSGDRLDGAGPGRRPGDARAGAGGRSPADWVLWRAADRGPAWEAPWGRGLPGRHLGCSVMSLRFLGERVDVHTGGVDLRFPHHEYGRAQCDAAAGHEVVRHWVHSENVLFDGHGIPESGGDAVLLKDVTGAGLDPLAVRLAFLEHHHRRPVNLTWETLRAADLTLRRWRARVAEWSESPSVPMPAEWVARVEAAFDDDLDTPLALRLLRELERDGSVAPGARFETFLHLDQVLGLDLSCDIGRAGSLPG